MLKFINIVNLAVIHKLKVELHTGLCLLTGETGAGKSIIVDALGLLLGRRGGAELIRTDAEMGLVEGVFDPGGRNRRRVLEILQSVGVNIFEGEELIIRRELQNNGRNRIFINDQRVTAATLKLLQPLLVEIQGQGEQYALTSSHNHLELLDIYAQCLDSSRATAKAFEAWQEAAGRLEALRARKSERERLGDFLQFQIAEIDKVNPQVEEEARLQAERNLLAHAEKALELSSSSYFELYESDQSVLARLGSIRKKVQELTAIDSGAGSWAESIETASTLLSDVAEGLRDFGAGVDFSTERLAEVEGRLVQLEALKRKFGRDTAGLIGLRDELSEQLEETSFTAEKEGELAGEVEAAKEEYLKLARALSEKRHAAAPRLEASVEAELRQLALEKARFLVDIKTASIIDYASDNDRGVELGRPKIVYSREGIDRVEFLLSANVGEVPRGLSRVASGGELSRVLLALQTVCLGRNSDSDGASEVTLVFDEIDAGIGGRAADAVGLRLKELGRKQQVLCVTHQAQIARYADHHFVVSKAVEGGRTLTEVRELQDEERVGELARMIGGSKDASAVRETARWMLEKAPKDTPKAKRLKGRRGL